MFEYRKVGYRVDVPCVARCLVYSLSYRFEYDELRD
ncbi:hypothetical protein [Bacillus sp. FSL R10-2201]